MESKGLQAPQMSLAPQLDPKKGLVEDLLYFLTAEDNPSRYALGFDRLAAWVDNSLDQYQVLHIATSTRPPCASQYYVEQHSARSCMPCPPVPCHAHDRMHRVPGEHALLLHMLRHTCTGSQWNPRTDAWPGRSQSCGAGCMLACPPMQHPLRSLVWLLAQPELRRVLYPLFIYTFLQLVERGPPRAAPPRMAPPQPRVGAGAPPPPHTRQPARRGSALPSACPHCMPAPFCSAGALHSACMVSACSGDPRSMHRPGTGIERECYPGRSRAGRIRC